MTSILARALATAAGAALPADAATVHFTKGYYNSPGADRGSNASREPRVGPGEEHHQENQDPQGAP